MTWPLLAFAGFYVAGLLVLYWLFDVAGRAGRKADIPLRAARRRARFC